MNYGSGSLTIAALRNGTRTVLERVRYDGISRCSRAFGRGDAALVVLSQLGPGVVRGDAVSTRGHLRAGAHLIVTSQTSTRLMGGARPARFTSRWTLDDGATLELIGEPLVAYADAAYDALTDIELGARASVLISEIAAVPAAAAVRLRTSIVRAGRELFYDAFEPAAAAPQTVGTFAIVGRSESAATELTASLDRAADRLGADALRAGIGLLPTGVFARLIGPNPWSVRCALGTLHAAARTVTIH